MPIIIKNWECPCKDCKFYGVGRSVLHFCKRLNQEIAQHKGNSFHYAGQWIIPCGKEFRLFKEK